MKERKSLHVGLILIGVFLTLSGPVAAGVTGKIRGKVVDAETGTPLPGANVFISSVWMNHQELGFSGSLGAASTVRGDFIILEVPPGIYSVTASMMGYAPVVRRPVKVSVDRTTILDFSLRETTLELGEELVVEASRDLIQLDVSATENYITAEEYQNTPFANRVEEVIALQSGVSGNIIEGKIKIREGETREVGLLIDGMSLVDKKFNRPVFSVQPGMVQEIKIMRNGFNAEYGQSRSGVINIITKDPSDRYHLSLDYQFMPAQKPHFGRNKFDPDYRWEWRLLTGPKAFEGDTLFIPDGRYESMHTWVGWNQYAENLLNDNNPDNDLTATEAHELWKWRHRPAAYGNRNGHNVDVSLSGPTPLLPWKSNFLWGGKFEIHPFDYPQSTNYYGERMTALKLVNRFSSDMKLTVNGMYSEVSAVAQGSLNHPWREEYLISYSGGDFQEYYPFYKPIIKRYTSLIGANFVHTISPTLFYEINLNHFYIKWGIARSDSARAEDGRYFHGRLFNEPQTGMIPKQHGVDDKASGYRMYGADLTWDDSWNRRLVFSAALTNQFHRAHEVKFGFNFNYDILREDRLLWHDEDPAQEYIRQYKVKPFEIGAYLQDKIEFEGMVANVGVRFDYFNTNSDRPQYYRALEYASDRDLYEAFVNGTYPTFRARPRYYFSPRVGIAHPLSERSKIYFNYGHFVQTPPTRDLYTATIDGARPAIQMVGNPELPLEKTIAFELGYDMGLSDAFQVHVGAFYKNNSDISSRMTYAHVNQSLILDWFSSNDYAEIRGLEIEIRKSAGRFFTGWLNYNYIKKSKSDLSIPNLSDNPIITDDPNVGVNGRVWGIPVSEIILVEPNARGVLTLMAPAGWGPKLEGYSLLGDTRLSFQVFYQGGPYRQHPRRSFRDANPHVRFKELDRYWANVRISRRFDIKSVNTELYLDISNILHTKFRYPPSGRSGEDYYDDLWESGRLNQVGTDDLSDPKILRTEDDDVWWAKVKTFVFGLRVSM